MRPRGMQLRRAEQLLSILMAILPLVCSLLSFLMFVKYDERGSICKAVSQLGIAKSVIAMTLRGDF